VKEYLVKAKVASLPSLLPSSVSFLPPLRYHPSPPSPTVSLPFHTFSFTAARRHQRDELKYKMETPHTHLSHPLSLVCFRSYEQAIISP